MPINFQTKLGGPAAVDPNWANVELLLNFDNADFTKGATTAGDITSGFTDLSTRNRNIFRVQTGGVNNGSTGATINVNGTDNGGGSGILPRYGYASFYTSPIPTGLSGAGVAGAYAGIFTATGTGTTGLGFIASQNFTIEAWVYFTSNQIARTIVGSDGTNGWSLEVVGNVANTLLFRNAGADILTSTISMANNTWHHVAVTRASTNSLTMWVDGVSAATATSTAAFPIPVATVNLFGVGGSGNTLPFTGSKGFISGRIDSIRITSSTARYTTTFTPPTFQFPVTPRQLVLYHFNNNFTDSSTTPAAPAIAGGGAGTTFSSSTVKFGSNSLALDGSTTSAAFNGSVGASFATGFWPFDCDATVEFWFNWSNTAQVAQHLVQMGTALTARNNCWINGTTLNIFGMPATGITITTGQWYHVACVRFGNTVTAYLNGKAIGTSAPLNIAGPMAFQLGWQSYSGTPAQRFLGFIDEYSAVLGFAKYTQDFIPPTVALTSV